MDEYELRVVLGAGWVGSGIFMQGEVGGREYCEIGLLVFELN